MGLDPRIPLMVNPPAPTEGPLQQYANVLAIKNAQTRNQLQQQAVQTGQLQQQSEQMQVQQQKQDFEDSQKFRQAFKDASGDWDQTLKLATQNGVGPGFITKAQMSHVQQQKDFAALTESQQKISSDKADRVALEAQALLNLPPDERQAAHAKARNGMIADGTFKPEELPEQVPSEDDLKFHAATSKYIQTQLGAQKVAQIRASKPPEGELPLGPANASQLNSALQTRYQVLNPGKQLPPQFMLPATATQKDYDRIDKSLEQVEKAVGTKAQQDTANEMRRQTQEMVRQNQQDRQDKEGLQPVTGTDPKSGRDVLVSAAEAKQMGLTGTMKADADMVNKSQAARHWLPLAEKQGSTDRVNPNDPTSPLAHPEDAGILQLIDDLDRRGKLGSIASRWNDFLAGKVGSGDPEFQALRAKMGLSSTKLMQAHVGSRGGSFMLEHFEDLANAKKMDAPTLKAGVLSELDYMRDVAMLPQSAGGRRPQSSGGPPTGATMKVPGSDGKMHWSDGKQDLGVAQ